MVRCLLSAAALVREMQPQSARRGRRTDTFRWMGTIVAATVAALVVSALAACGGGGDDDDAAEAAPPAVAQERVDFARESDYGPGDAPGSTRADEARAAPTHASAVPLDRQAHTRLGLYLSRARAERVDQETGGQVVWVDANCCSGPDADRPERIAFGLMSVMGDEAPLFVTGADLRQAARLADRLEALGLRRVYLVTP